MWAGGSERNDGQEVIQVRRKEGQRVWNFFLQRHREGEEKTQNSFGMRIRAGDTFSVTMLGFSVKGEVSQDFSLFSWPFNYCSHLC
jgi:hypothetical protein